jgi:DNA repair protein RecO (recombination protein O)
MKQLTTRAIVLSRTDFGEADRIITVLTPDYGKLSLMAKGVRRQKSKLAGGIELFSVSDITYLPGRGSVSTLVSARLRHHYGDIVKDLVRVQLGYELTKRLHKTTEDNPEERYFYLLDHTYSALNSRAIDTQLIAAWFQAQLLRMAGHTPNLQTDINGMQLKPDQTYRLSIEDMTLLPDEHGTIDKGVIQVLRLLFGNHTPEVIARVRGVADHVSAAAGVTHMVAGGVAS